ncbi:hypothetical protein [Micromonospora sp. SL4-19]|uniref:hypothetical protein n=1 Tax=Micromonospora sp. SL4-19 TaxID=3399129 RepID=UPI003A4E36F6
MRILVVEDERRLADPLARGLREAGHRVDNRIRRAAFCGHRHVHHGVVRPGPLVAVTAVVGRFQRVGTVRHYRINDTCGGCFPSATDDAMGRPAPDLNGAR